MRVSIKVSGKIMNDSQEPTIASTSDTKQQPIKTYRQLLKKLQELELENNEWIDSPITVGDTYEGECYPADLKFATDEHDSLEDGYPIIVF